MGETPVPFVVCKADGEAGVAMLAELRERGIPSSMMRISSPLCGKAQARGHGGSRPFLRRGPPLVGAGIS